MISSKGFRRYVFRLIIFCLIPLLAGGTIYLLFRSDSLLLFRWIEQIGFESEVEKVRKFSSPFSKFIPDQVLFSVPDALWTFSLVWFLEIVWNESNNKSLTHRIFIISLIITVGFECFQYFYKSLGWFSFYDIFWIVIALFAFKMIRRIEDGN
jgi:hypothetical protein